MSNYKDYLERRKAGQKGTPAPEAPPEPIPPQGGTGTVKPSGPRQMIHQCGCPIEVKRLTSEACPSCRAAALKARKEKKRARAEARRPDLDPSKGRLPDGAAFHVAYEAETKTWKGVLCVPGHPNLTGQHSNVWRLLELLDRLWRDSQQKEAPHV